MAVVFQLEDGDAGTSDFADSKKNNIVSTAGENTPPKHFGVGAYEGKSSQAFVGSKATTPTAYQVKKQISFLKVETAAQSNTAAGTQTGTPSSIYTKDGVDFTLTTKKHTHIGNFGPSDVAAHLRHEKVFSAAIANPRIVSELGTGWEIADWNDFASFTEDDFKGFLRIIAPIINHNCSTLLALVGSSGSRYLRVSIGWILRNGTGDIGALSDKEHHFMSFANHHQILGYPPLTMYHNHLFVLDSVKSATFSYICKRTGSSLPNTKGGCF